MKNTRQNIQFEKKNENNQIDKNNSEIMLKLEAKAILNQIENAIKIYPTLNKHEIIRIKKWLDKLTSPMHNNL